MAAGAAIGGAIFGAMFKMNQNLNEQQQLKVEIGNLRIRKELSQKLMQFEIRQFMRGAIHRRGAIVAGGAAQGVRTDTGSAYETLMTQVREDTSQAIGIKLGRQMEIFETDTNVALTEYALRMKERTLIPDMMAGAAQGASMGMSFGSMAGPKSTSPGGVAGVTNVRPQYYGSSSSFPGAPGTQYGRPW